MSIHVQIEKFEGPLGLLLHLIRREEMDIFDINVHHITKQYLDYIKTMKKLDLEIAGEFIAMAATLIQIKSRMLLPQYNEDGEEIEIEDPRKELVQRLLEYQNFQEASQELYSRPLIGRDVWTRGQRLNLSKEQEEEIIVEENALFALISAYRAAIKNIKKSVHKVMAELQSISERILELKDVFVAGTQTTFFKIMGESRDKNQVLVTFLSLLELTRMGFISVFQSQNFDDIHIESKKTIEADVISKVENFESAGTDAMAEAISIGNQVDIPDDLTIDEEIEIIEEGHNIAAKEVVSKMEEQLHHEDILALESEEDGLNSLVKAATDDEIAEEERLIYELDHQSKDVNTDPIRHGESSDDRIVEDKEEKEPNMNQVLEKTYEGEV